MLSEAAKAGREVRAHLFGEAVGAARASDRVASFIGEVSDEANWGKIWARPGLELKTRSLCVIAALAAQDQWEHLEAHVRGARNIGVTMDELTELAGQLVFYATLPRVHRMVRIIDRVYHEDRTDESPTPTAPADSSGGTR